MANAGLFLNYMIYTYHLEETNYILFFTFVLINFEMNIFQPVLNVVSNAYHTNVLYTSTVKAGHLAKPYLRELGEFQQLFYQHFILSVGMV